MRWLLLCFTCVLAACSNHPPIRTEASVDIARFMGTWHVHGHVPLLVDGESYRQTESYRFEAPNIVHTTFQFNDGSPTGPLKTYTPTGFVDLDSGGGVWGMQFIWPFKAEYRIVYIDPDYSETIIGRSARDLVWIMSREPRMSDANYQRLLAIVKAEGYDTKAVRRVPGS